MNIKNNQIKKCLPCSTCGYKPSIDRCEFGYMIACTSCENVYGYIDGACYNTFPWQNINDAIHEWNEIVNNKNSWYTEEWREPIQLKIIL